MTCRVLYDEEGRPVGVACSKDRRRSGPRSIQEVLPMPQLTMPVQAACKSCGAPVFWATTKDGKAMPVDVEPRLDGNVLLFRRSNGLLRAEVIGKDVPRSPDRKYRVSHLATCPAAANHRGHGRAS